mgnify:CR=1 FL=1
MTRYYLVREGAAKSFARVDGSLAQAKREAEAFSRLAGAGTILVFRREGLRKIGRLTYIVRGGVERPREEG